MLSPARSVIRELLLKNVLQCALLRNVLFCISAVMEISGFLALEVKH